MRLQIKESEEGNWTEYTPGSNNRFANISHVHLNTPKMIWTGNQSSAIGPYPIELSQQYLPKITQPDKWVYHRRADIENRNDSTALSLEWGEIEVITKSGETLGLEFAPCKSSINLGLDASTVMDYLATSPVTLPTTAEQLRFHYHIFTSCQQDTAVQKVTTAFTKFNVTFRLTDLTFSKSYALTETFADPHGAINDQQNIIVDVQSMIGSSMLIKPEINGMSLEGNQFSYALGHIYIEKDKALPKPLASNLKIPEPKTLVLFQNYPNPFNPTTTIQFDLPTAGEVTLKIYNLRGELVRTLIEERRNAGIHRVLWDGADEHGRRQSSGVYFYQLETTNFNAVRKLVLIK